MMAQRRGQDEKSQIFSESETEYLAENMLGRIATVSASSQPHVVPVAYGFDGTNVYFGGRNLESSLKYRNLLANNRVAFVVDEIVSTHPWRAKGIEIRGLAEPFRGEEGDTLVRIRPNVVRSWGLRG